MGKKALIKVSLNFLKMASLIMGDLKSEEPLPMTHISRKTGEIVGSEECEQNSEAYYHPLPVKRRGLRSSHRSHLTHTRESLVYYEAVLDLAEGSARSTSTILSCGESFSPSSKA